MSVAVGMATGFVLVSLLGVLAYLTVGATGGGGDGGSSTILPIVLSLKAGAVLGAVVGCWALHRLYWRCEDGRYRRRCVRVGRVIMLEVVAAAALLLAIALGQPALAEFRSPPVAGLLGVAWLLPAVFVGQVLRVKLVAKVMSNGVGRLERTALDNPRDSASQMIAGLTRLALSPLVAIKAVFQGVLGLLDSCMHIDLGGNRSSQRKKP